MVQRIPRLPPSASAIPPAAGGGSGGDSHASTDIGEIIMAAFADGHRRAAPPYRAT